MDLSEGTEKLDQVVSYLKGEISKIRAGQASPEMVEDISVDVYSSRMPVSHVATIAVPDPRTIHIQPWDQGNVKSIEKAILASGIGITPIVDGKVIRLSIPPLTAELREQYIHTMKEKVEDARVSIRGIRHKMLDALEEQRTGGGFSEDEVKRMKDEVEKEVKRVMDEIDTLSEAKEEELRTV
ncbi:MAG: ribosome recycling factor [Candidatus Dojkabacteria bacterium]|nr:ribosome recycling factor [Candidatus Dojkabacteria bacterium]